MPDALLFVTPQCPHCATVKRALAELQQQGVIGRIEMVDATLEPVRAADLGVKSVPWLQLGPFTLTGAQGVAELKQWAARAEEEAGIAHYLEYLLRQGEFAHARAFVAADTARLARVLSMLADTGLGIDVRLGLSALLERYAQQEPLRGLLPQLIELAQHPDHRVRADVCHLLGLTGSLAARAPLERCLQDDHAEVREIAAEALQQLEALKC